VAPEHPIVKDLIKDSGQRPQLEQFIFETVNLDRFKRTAEETEKKGVFTGRYAINPLNGTKVPIYLANFVLMEYGTGAIMAVPAHDQRDFEFAKKYGLPIRVVIQNPSRSLVPASMTGAYVEEGVMSHSGAFDGLPSPEGLKRIASWIEEKKIGRKTKHTRLRDWLISRQRYWGAPIPIIYCDCCGMVPVPEKDLPVLLPDDAVFNPNGESPLKTSPTFSKTVCPTCGKPARRETDTMDTFVDSSWYFLRYLYPRDDKQAFGPLVNDWLPVDQYIGGIEHAILHLLYARFFVKALHRFGLVGFREPFRNLFTQGMIIKNGFKMSKSKGNVVNPKPLIEQYGADTVRLYTLFIGPPEKDAEWNDEAVEGASRFLNRFWYLCAEHEGLVRNAPDAPPALGDKQSKKLYHVLNKLVKKITDDIEGAFHFNTAISGIMELTNALADYLSSSDSPDPALVRSVVLKTTLCLSPFAPHICEELWVRLTGKTGGIMLESWPEYDPSALKADEVTVVFQVNGKIRSKIETASGTPKDELEKAALADPALAKWLEGLTVRKIVVIPDKLVNIVAT
jgi:leucyl-tRNA synthetase